MNNIDTRYERYCQLNSTILFQFYFYAAQNDVDKASADFSVHDVHWVAPNLRITHMTCVCVCVCVCVFFFLSDWIPFFDKRPYSSSVLRVVGVTSVIIIKGPQLLISGAKGPQYLNRLLLV